MVSPAISGLAPLSVNKYADSYCINEASIAGRSLARASRRFYAAVAVASRTARPE
jgi:hypothetical protein